MRQTSIQIQILRLACIPLLLVTLILDGFILYSRHVDVTKAVITQQEFNDLIFQTLAASGILLGIFVYFVILASRRIIDPVIKLGADMQAIAQDIPDLSGTASTTVNELNALAQAINTQTRKLQLEHEILQQRIDEATQALRDKKDMAERANQNSSRFLAVASHELRQPLHALSLYISELQRKVAGTEQQYLVSKVNHSVEALSQMLNGLLDISKLDARTIVPQIQACSMAGLLERVSANHTVLASLKNIRLVVRPCCCYVSSDPQLLERIVMNLVSNAIRYTPVNGSVLVACRHRGKLVRIEVRDNGVGIAKEDQENIFREFHQCKQHPLDTEKGLGLGLAIVDRLAKLLGHQLLLRSIPNVGTVFALQIPSAIRPDNTASQIISTPNDISAISSLKGKKLLIVDDDPLVLESTVHILSSWGCIVSSADSMAAVKKLLSEGFKWDLIITDFQLEENTTGLSVIQEVKQKLNEAIPCILITGNTSQEITRLVKLGGDWVLYKPVRPAKLRSLVEFLLNESGQ